MKLKNSAIILGVALISFGKLSAQEFKVSVQNTKEGKLTLTEFSGDLPIEGYSGNEIIIVSENTKSEVSARAKGLKPIYPGGEDNTGVGLFMEKNGNQVSFRCLLPITHRQGNYKIKVPENFKIQVDNECAKGGKVTVRNMKNELEIKNCHDIELKNVSGSVVVSTISGDVDVVFSDIDKDKPLSIATISGEVDVTLPSKAAVSVEIGSMSGTIYSDFDFPSEDKNMKKVGGGGVAKTALNGGGVALKISSISGNVYLRKAK